MSLYDEPCTDEVSFRCNADTLRLNLADRAVDALTRYRSDRAADALHEWITDGVVEMLIRDYPDVLEDMASRWADGLTGEDVVAMNR